MKSFIKELRNSGEARKKRFLIGGSAITMCLVVVLWVIYLNFSLETIVGGRAEELARNDSNGFWPTMKRGTAILYEEFAQLIKRGVDQKKEIIIQPQKNYQVNDIKPIAPQTIK